MKVVLTDTDRLEWILKYGKVPQSHETYWGSKLWFIPGIPRVKATTFRAALNDAIRKEALTSHRTMKREKRYARHDV